MVCVYVSVCMCLLLLYACLVFVRLAFFRYRVFVYVGVAVFVCAVVFNAIHTQGVVCVCVLGGPCAVMSVLFPYVGCMRVVLTSCVSLCVSLF